LFQGTENGSIMNYDITNGSEWSKCKLWIFWWPNTQDRYVQCGFRSTPRKPQVGSRIIPLRKNPFGKYHCQYVSVRSSHSIFCY
jgi:hypothetical protein